MAKVQLGYLVGEVRNKVGDLVYSRNRGGAYTKRYAVPFNPNTEYQQDGRFRFYTVQREWSNLTEAQRLAWLDAAPLWPRPDNIGNRIQLPGYNLFMSLNLNLSLIGASLIAVPPSKQGVASLTSFSFNCDLFNGQMNINCSPAIIPANNVLVICATPALPPTRYYCKNLYRAFYQYNPGDEPNDDNFVFQYLNRFALPTTGERCSVKAYFINSTTGEAGPAYTATAIST